jgi:hypothetical protein
VTPASRQRAPTVRLVALTARPVTRAIRRRALTVRLVALTARPRALAAAPAGWPARAGNRRPACSAARRPGHPAGPAARARHPPGRAGAGRMAAPARPRSPGDQGCPECPGPAAQARRGRHRGVACCPGARRPRDSLRPPGGGPPAIRHCPARQPVRLGQPAAPAVQQKYHRSPHGPRYQAPHPPSGPAARPGRARHTRAGNQPGPGGTPGAVRGWLVARHPGAPLRPGRVRTRGPAGRRPRPGPGQLAPGHRPDTGQRARGGGVGRAGSRAPARRKHANAAMAAGLAGLRRSRVPSAWP